MNVVNFFVPISYYITEANVYERRPFSYVYYFAILYYCITALVRRANGFFAMQATNSWCCA